MTAARAALITGASSRLAAPLARFFAGRGYALLLHQRRPRKNVAALAEELRGQGSTVEVMTFDFAERANIDAFCAGMTKPFGVPEAIVNNASNFVHDFPGAGNADLLAESFLVHMLAPFMIMETACKDKRAEQKLSVFNILDQKLLNLNPDYYSYTLGKSGLMTMTEIWARAGRDDVRAFGLLPGLMFPSGPQSDERFVADSAKIPTGRALPPENLCALIGFLLDHPDMPGALFPLDGGEHLLGRRRDVAFE
ncbi:NAD(P)-dependent dehydrogenase (short-subunit alcohol dehydrogenase family) [Rhodoblastus acidophilus]|uniref:SDR family NAD(P)-dependent oxidoreductase n=1 Tax=Rhodoblastus acidophilus TaxID=1074 RepID=UPI0022249BDE|nr:SDR family NAD(P)-dependent oxidoreductase [Rhodoblastus acidophilus]MCW2286115.1 NAD(P)-dependent dehydrogenase (short-subunit alcohol dehydrogenase family) [Rhodoblastus acidophilus]MCW2335009.1 NAD(P)-dependent dehydrogenase (short-subunit alcohol dehydrogenase family) [Rhodoblastus acidophilus]